MSDPSSEAGASLSVLFVEDAADDWELNRLELRRAGFDVVHACAASRESTEQLLKERKWDVVLSDHAMPGFSSREVIDLVRSVSQDTPCIIVSGAVGEDAAVELLQAGAVDYVNKGKLHRLAPAVRRALEEAHSRRGRREAEAALRESERQLRELNEHLEQRVQERSAELLAQNRLIETALNTMRDVFYVTDTQLGLVRWNHELRAATGLDDSTLGGRVLGALVHPEDAEALNAWAEAVRRRGDATAELRLRTDDGGYSPYEFRGSLLRDADGEPEGICGIAQNVSGRRQTERQLKEAIRAVISDATWFAQSVLEKMSQVDDAATGAADVELTDRESEVLDKLAAGLRNEQIAQDLGISYSTVRNYVARLYDKLGVHSRAEAVIWARERGFGQAESRVIT